MAEGVRTRGWASRIGRTIGDGLRLATARFPVAAAAILVISVFANLEVQSATGFAPDDLAWLIAALFTAGAVSVSAVLIGEARRYAYESTQGLSVLFGVAAGLIVWFGTALGILAPALILACVLFVPVAPFARRAGLADTAFWNFTLWTFVGVVLAFLSVLLFVLGVSAILEMIRYLFQVGLSSDAYEHIFVTAFTLIGPLFALGQVPPVDETPSSPEGDRLAGGVRILFDWVAAPLTLATAAVLHLYAAKIAVQAELPLNEVGWIVTFYIFLVLALRIAIHPFAATGAWPTRVIARGWWALLVVPLGLLALAVSLRIQAEGWTFDRYYLALGGIAAALCVVLQAIPRQRGSIIVLALVPTLLLLVSSAGPLGVEAVVERSQGGIIAERFVVDGRLKKGSELDPVARSELRTRLYALDEIGGLDVLSGYVEPESLVASLEASSWSGDSEPLQSLMAAYGIDVYETVSTSMRVLGATVPTPLDTTGYDRVMSQYYVMPGQAPVQPSSRGFSVRLSSMRFEVAIDGDTAAFDLAEAIDGLPKSVFDGTQEIAPPVIDVVSVDGRRHLRVAFHMLQIDDATRAISYASATLFWRSSEWTPSLGGRSGGGQGTGVAPASPAETLPPEPAGAVGEGAR